jgi:hypothetical protein
MTTLAAARPWTKNLSATANVPAHVPAHSAPARDSAGRGVTPDGLLVLLVALLLLASALRLLRRTYVPIVAELLRIAAQGVLAGLLVVAAIVLLIVSALLR